MHHDPQSGTQACARVLSQNQQQQPAPWFTGKKKKKKQRLNPGKLTLIRVKALQPDDYDVMFFCKELRKTYKTSSG